MPTRVILQETGYVTVTLTEPTPVFTGFRVQMITVLPHVRFIEEDDTHVMFDMRGLGVVVERRVLKDVEVHTEKIVIPVNLAGWYHRPTPGLPSM